MALPEIRPIRTTDRVVYELTPGTDAYEWTPVRKTGARLTAIVRPLSFLEVRECSLLDDAQTRLDRILDLGFVSASHEGSTLPVDAIPYSHRAALSFRIFELSAVGADPFGGAPAESPH